MSSYNEMLSAHAPYKTFPDIIKQLHVKMVVLHSLRAVYRQCVMVLLKVMPVWNYHYFRETIAMGTAIALSHNVRCRIVSRGMR